MAKLFAIFLVLFAIYHSGWGLKCYACNSNKVKECGDPPTIGSITLHDCMSDKNSGPANTVSCLKIITEETGNSMLNVTRKCITHVKDMDACKNAVPELKPPFSLKSCVACTTDGCNAAGVMSTSVLAVFAFVLATMANFYFNA